MLIKLLELKNFCQHRQLTLDFNSGLTSIVGPNGCGKSNVLTALRYAFTGDITNSGKKEQNICQFANKAAKSYVRVIFSHGDVEAEIVRYLRPSSAKDVMTYSDGVSIHGAVKINAALEDLLGDAYNLLSDIVIVSQGDIFGFLTRTAAKRAEFFQNLFKVDRAKQIYNYLTKYLSEHPEQVLLGDIETLQEELKNYNAQLLESVDKNSALVKQFGSADILEERISKGSLIIQTRDLVDSIQRELEELDIEIKSSETEKKILEENAKKLEKEYYDNSLLISQHRDTYESAKEQLVLYKNARRVVAKAQESMAELVAVRQEFENLNLSINQLPACEDLGKLDKAVREVLNGYEPLKALLTKLANLKDSSVCPTCGQSLEPVLARREELQKQFNSLHEAYIAAKQAYDNSKAVESKKENLQKRLEIKQALISSLEKNISTSGIDETILSLNVVDLENIVDEQNGRLSLDNAISSDRLRVSQSITNLKNAIEALSKRRVAIQQKLKALKAPKMSKEQLVAFQDVLKGQKQQVLASEEEIKIYRWQIDSCEKNIKKYETESVQVARYNKWRSFVSSLREVFHKDAAPKIYAIKYLKNIESVINSYLEVFEADFRVETDESLSFTAHFVDGRIQEASRLSGGQSVILALAFRLAINFVFAEELGFLALDEPTAYLDEHHIAGFEPVLNNLRELTNSREIQLLIVTHEQRLSPLFDNVIELETTVI